MKKIINIKGVIDSFKSGSTSSPNPGGPGSEGQVKLEHDIIESLVQEQFTAESTLRHGFPFKPLSMAFDPIQKLLAIGNRSGAVRIYGKPGIDIEFVHDSPCQVFQLIFIVNTGKILTACTDDTINLWDFKRKKPGVLQTIKFQKERITCINVEFLDQWLYIGTEKGNVYLMNLETFNLSGYQMDWNKLMDPMQKNHPGAVSHLSCSPVDNGKILIGFETGQITLWDLTTKKGEQRYYHNQRLTSISWNMDGKQFVCSHNDGSLVTWQTVKPVNNKPSSVIFPHGKRNKESGKMEGRCDPIEKVFWGFNRSQGDSFFIFSGGLQADVTGVTPSITYMQGKNTTLLEMEYCVLDFAVATDSPYLSDWQEPESIIAMLTNDLVAIDCKSNGYPCFKNPYAMDFNESPVTCCKYLVDCPGDLIPAIYIVGSKAKQGSSRGFSAREWPINGGLDTGTESCSYTELVITGHADGSIRFWDGSSTTMQALYKIKTSKFFERNKKHVEGVEDDPYAVTQITMCPESKSLCVAGASAQVIFFSFRKKDTETETKSMEIPIVYEVSNMPHGGSKPDSNSPHNPGNQHFEFPPRPLLQVASQSSSYTDPGADCFNFDKIQYEYTNPFRLRIGAQKKAPGFHAELVCLTPWVNGEAPTQINCVELNTNYGLMAYGNMAGLVIVDVVQNLCLLNMGTADLYGSADPFQRLPKSPRPFNSSPGDDIVRVDLSNYSGLQADKNDTSDGATQINNNSDSVKTPKDSLGIKNITGTVKAHESKRLQKTGSSAEESISKSHSSSTNSLDQIISSEGVCSANFADSFPTKGDFRLNACLYVGTTLGSIIVIQVNLPDRGDPRLNEPVVVSPTGSVFRTRGALITTCFLDTSSSVLTTRDGEPAENVHVPSRSQALSQPVPSSAGGEGSVGTSASSSSNVDQQIAIFCSDKSSVVYALPSQRQMYSQTINESANVVTAAIINFGGGKYTPCLVCFTADGFLKAYSLPSLRPMLDMYYIALSTPRIARTMNISNYGHGIFFSNPTELQKFSINSEFLRQLPEMTGQVFTDNIPMPEAPKKNILQAASSWFTAAPKPCEREQLFGEEAGKTRATVKNIPGAGMTHLQAKSISSGSEISKAKMAAIERGQRLNELEDRTEEMANQAKIYSQTSNKLLNKYKDKKWYQL